MKIRKLTFILVCLVATLAASAQTTELAPAAITPVVSGFTAEHVFALLMAAVIGSLGTLGLLLGLDRILLILLRFGVLKSGDTSADSKRYSADSVAKILPLVIYGITIILIVLSVMIFGLMRIISSEGALGILASIVGYVLGRSSVRGAVNKQDED